MIIKLAILLAILLIVTGFAAWAFLPARHLPGNRARHLRIRLHLRLHPGKGFAHLFSLWLRWSRFAVLRRSGQIRPALPWRYSLLDPREHSVFLGRAHYRHRLRVPLEEHLLVMAPPRTYKTEAPTAAWLMRSTPPEPRPSRACAPMATPGPRPAPGSASPARPLSNAGDNVASPAVPHTTATGGKSRSPPYPAQPELVGLGAP